jgi:hypothetical protein
MITDYFIKLNLTQIVGLITFVVGLVILALSTIATLKSISSKEWLTTGGKIIHSTIYNYRETNEANSTYRPDIAFEYGVDGEKFISDRLYYGVKIMSSGNWAKSRKLIEKYPVDKEIIVFYNPNNPKEAVIEPGIHLDLGALFISSICLVALGLIIFLNSEIVTRLLEQSK